MTIDMPTPILRSARGPTPRPATQRDPGNGARGTCPAFLFAGHGPQYEGMAEELFKAHAAFRETLEQCHESLGADLKPRLLDVLYGPENGVRTAVLRVSQAFHSPHMKPVLDDHLVALRSVRFSPPASLTFPRSPGLWSATSFATAGTG